MMRGEAICNFSNKFCQDKTRHNIKKICDKHGASVYIAVDDVDKNAVCRHN